MCVHSICPFLCLSCQHSYIRHCLFKSRFSGVHSRLCAPTRPSSGERAHTHTQQQRHTTPHHLAATQPWHYNQRIQCIQRVSATISAVGVVAAPCGSLICLIRRRYLTSCSVWSGIQLLHTFQRVHISAAKQADRHKFSNKIQCGKATNSTFNVSMCQSIGFEFCNFWKYWFCLKVSSSVKL